MDHVRHAFQASLAILGVSFTSTVSFPPRPRIVHVMIGIVFPIPNSTVTAFWFWPIVSYTGRARVPVDEGDRAPYRVVQHCRQTHPQYEILERVHAPERFRDILHRPKRGRDR